MKWINRETRLVASCSAPRHAAAVPPGAMRRRPLLHEMLGKAGPEADNADEDEIDSHDHVEKTGIIRMRMPAIRATKGCSMTRLIVMGIRLRHETPPAGLGAGLEQHLHP